MGNLIKFTKNYTSIPNEILYSTNLSFKEKGLWAYLNSKPEGWDFSSIRIAKETKEHAETIQRILKNLESAGYLKRERTSNLKMNYYFSDDCKAFCRTVESLKDKMPYISNTEFKSNTENNKENYNKSEKVTVFSFDEFWEKYNKKIEKKKVKAKYAKISEANRKLIKDTLDDYLKATPVIQFRKYPWKYLNDEAWNDDYIQPVKSKHARIDLSQSDYTSPF